jgi:hypothetical protein
MCNKSSCYEGSDPFYCINFFDLVIEITVCTNQFFFIDITEDKEIEMFFTYSVKEVET